MKTAEQIIKEEWNNEDPFLKFARWLKRKNGTDLKRWVETHPEEMHPLFKEWLMN